MRCLKISILKINVTSKRKPGKLYDFPGFEYEFFIQSFQT